MAKKKKNKITHRGPKYQRYLGEVREDYIVKETSQALGTAIYFTNEQILDSNLLKINVYKNSTEDYGILISHKFFSQYLIESLNFEDANFSKRENLRNNPNLLLVRDWDPLKRSTQFQDKLSLNFGLYDFYAYREPYKNCIENMLIENDFSILKKPKYNKMHNCYANHLFQYAFPDHEIKKVIQNKELKQ